MSKERNKADDYREKACLNCPLAYAASPFSGDAQRYELAANGGDAQAQFATGWFLMTGTGVPKDECKGLKWIHKSTFQGGRTRDVDNIVGGTRARHRLLQGARI